MENPKIIELLNTVGTVEATLTKIEDCDTYNLTTANGEIIRAVKVEKIKKGLWLTFSIYPVFILNRFFVSNKIVKRWQKPI